MAVYKRHGSKFYLYDFTVEGKRFRGSTKSTKLTEANAREAALMVEVKERGRMPGREAKTPTLREFSARFLMWADSSRRIEKATRDYYRLGWHWMSEQNIAGMRIDRITSEDADMVRVEGSASSQNCALRTLRRMLNLATSWELIRKAPKIHLLEERKRTQLIDGEMESRIVQRLEGARISSALRIGIFLMLDAGMRPKEIVSMRAEDVDIKQGLVYIPKSKTLAGARYVPMTDRLKEKLFALTAIRSSGWLFPSRVAPGEHIQRQALTQMWRKIARELGIPTDVKLYCARHQFATDAMKATKNPFLVMRMLGHTELRTTERYQHHDVAEVGELMNARNEERHSSRHSATVIN